MKADVSRLRTERIPVRCSPAEKAFLHAAASQLEVTVSEYMRQAGIEKAEREIKGLKIGVDGAEAIPTTPARPRLAPPPPALRR